ncbi:hypothetical protein JCM10207_001347 [Rhodosporidiobolus poonsookiae]
MPLPPAVSSTDFARPNGTLPVSPSFNPAPSSTRLRLAVLLDRKLLVAGQTVTGSLEVHVRNPKSKKSGDGLWLGEIGVELSGFEELRSRTHTSTRRLLSSRIDFQGSGRPPSVAVQTSAAPLKGHFYPALSGRTRFEFSFPLPADLPSSCTLGGNATTRYELRAFATSLVGDNVDIKSEKAEVVVVERWADWKDGEWAHKGVERRAAEKLALGGEGKVEVVASVGKSEWDERPHRLFWRREMDLGVEGKSRIAVRVKVRNASKRHVTGIKLTLLRRLRLLSSDSSVDAPVVSTPVHSERFHGVAYDVASNQERDTTVEIHVPPDQECWTVRKGGLFELDAVVRVEVECGFLAKSLAVDLPIFISHPLSVPNSAHRFIQAEKQRLALPSTGNGYHPPPPSVSPGPPATPNHFLPPPSEVGVQYHRPRSPSQSEIGFPMPHSPSSTIGFGGQQYHQQQFYPGSNPVSPLAADFVGANLPLPGATPPPPPPQQQHYRSFPPQQQHYAESTVSLAPSASSPALYHTPSPAPHFSAPPPPPSLSQVYHPVPPPAHDPHSQGYIAFSPTAPDLTPSGFLGALRSAQPSYAGTAAIPSREASEVGLALPVPVHSPPPTCPSPAPSASPTVPAPPPAVEMLPHLSPAEQAEVDARLSTPVRPYSAMGRAHQSSRTGDGSRSRSREREREPERTDDRPPTPPRPCPSPVPSLRSPRQQRATPPPVSPSSAFRAPSPSPSLAAAVVPGGADNAFLETIGEDGESQAGTARSAALPRSLVDTLKQEGEAARAEEEAQVRQRDITAVEAEEKKARRVSVAEELEEWVERDDERRAEERRRSAASLPSPQLEQEKTLPPPPPPRKEAPRPTVQEVFQQHPTAPARSPVLPPPPRDPSGLSALEARLLSRSPSPAKPPSPPTDTAPVFPAASSPASSAALAPPSSVSSGSGAHSALRARSISRASRLVEDEQLRRAIEEAERDPSESVRRAVSKAEWVKPLPKPTAAVEASVIKEEKQAKRRTLPALPMPSPPPSQPTEQPFVPPSPRRALPLPPSPALAPTSPPSPLALIPSSPLKSPTSPSGSKPPVSPVNEAGRKVVDTAELKQLKKGAAERITGWLSSSASVSASESEEKPASPDLPLPAKKEKVSPWSSFAKPAATGATPRHFKRHTIEFGRLAPAPPASSVSTTSSPQLDGTASSKTSSSALGSTSTPATSPSLGATSPSLGATSPNPSFRPSHRHTLSVPLVSAIPPAIATSSPAAAPVHAALSPAQHLAFSAREDRECARERIGSPPPWAGQARDVTAAAGAVVKGAEGYLAALKRDEEGGAKGEVGRKSARAGRQGKVRSVVGIWAEREVEAQPTFSRHIHTRGAKSLSYLPSSVTSPALSTATSYAASPSPAKPTAPVQPSKPLAASTLANSSSSASPTTVPGTPRSRPVFGSSARASPGASAPAKPFLNTTLGRPSASTSPVAAALRVPSGAKSRMVGSESAPDLSTSAARGTADGKAASGGARVRDLLRRYQAQVQG